MRVDVIAPQEEKDKDEVRRDPTLKLLSSSRPQQIEQWVDRNVTDLDSAKTVLKTLAKAVALLSKQL